MQRIPAGNSHASKAQVPIQATALKPDFYIINAENPSNPTIISSLNTGPGLNAIEVAGPYVYVANSGTTAQLQIIDIHDRNTPILISKFKHAPHKLCTISNQKD